MILEKEINNYLSSNSTEPLLICGDSFDVLKSISDESIDCIITSPPYFQKREYINGSLGLESNYIEYINKLLICTSELYRVLKKSGSLWINIGDSFLNKQLLNIPHRLAIKMQDEQNWILRNTIIWDKIKGAMTNSKDNLGSEYEFLFHFVKARSGYYYNQDAIRKKPREATVKDGVVISATGVSGIKYKRKIELSTELSIQEKESALKDLDKVLNRIKNGEISDFRMVIRGANQRVTNGDSIKLSGRAKELKDKGYYFLFYNPKGSMISDVWQIIPEDSHGREIHFAAYPEDLVKTPLLLTCPKDGIVLDPFVGTGTTSLVAKNNNIKSIGIDLSKEYIEYANKRINKTRG